MTWLLDRWPLTPRKCFNIELKAASNLKFMLYNSAIFNDTHILLGKPMDIVLYKIIIKQTYTFVIQIM